MLSISGDTVQVVFTTGADTTPLVESTSTMDSPDSEFESDIVLL